MNRDLSKETQRYEKRPTMSRVTLYCNEVNSKQTTCGTPRASGAADSGAARAFAPWSCHTLAVFCKHSRKSALWSLDVTNSPNFWGISRAFLPWSCQTLAMCCKDAQKSFCTSNRVNLHYNLHGTQLVSNPATKKDLAARTWGVFWYSSKIPHLFELMV